MMNLKQFYENIGGNYDDAISRLMNDSLIERFVTKFYNNQKLDALKAALDAKDYDQVFAEAHTLKGVSLNLSFVKLGQSASELTDMVRGDSKLNVKHEDLLAKFEIVERNYQEVITNYENQQI